MGVEKGKILVVDDEDLNRSLLQAILTDAGYTVKLAWNGVEALEALGAEPFDAVVLDLMMPRMNGYQVLETMQADPDMQNIPVVVISAIDATDSVARCIQMGATDYLTKPFNSAVLNARINASLASKRIRDMEQAHLKEIRAERERAEDLLRNMLPEPIAEQLKLGHKLIAESFAEATVLFADLMGFTAFTTQRSPTEVLNTLNTVFSAFDDLVESAGLEKIKTSGDSYMVAGGVPIPRSDHAEAVAELALELQAEVRRLGESGAVEPLHIRVGIHSGPVIAGVIGTKKYTYDLWGDTVNTASRMEANAVADGILTTAETYERLKDKFVFEEHGPVEIKGKGEMSTYLLVGRKE